MKILGLWLGASLAFTGALSAQVTIELSLDQEQFLPGETLPVIVRIANRSGQTLTLGTDEDWLKFSVESQDVPIVVKNGDAPVAEKIVLDSAKAAIKRVNLAPYFNLKKPGHYSVLATAIIRDWNQQIVSAPRKFDIINAAKLRELEFGVPLPAGATSRPPEVRKYTLLQANYLKTGLTLYFQLSEASGKLDKVFPLGRMLNILPDTRLDHVSNLHLLYQVGPHSACYTVISPSGELLKRQTYEFTTHPNLKVDDEGNVLVDGAIRVEKSNDLPPAVIEEVKAPEPIAAPTPEPK